MSTPRHIRRRSLRVALVQDGQILQDRSFAPDHTGAISLGFDAQNTLVMPPHTHGIPGEEGFVILKPSQNSHGRHTLRLGAHFTGKLRVANRNFHLQDLLASPLASPTKPLTTLTDDGLRIEQPSAEVEIGPGDWGMLHIGAVDVIFQYVAAHEAPTRRGWLRDAAQQLGSPLGLGVLLGLVAQSSLMFWMSTQEEPSLEQLVEHSAEDRLSQYEAATSPAHTNALTSATFAPSCEAATLTPDAHTPCIAPARNQETPKATSSSQEHPTTPRLSRSPLPYQASPVPHDTTPWSLGLSPQSALSAPTYTSYIPKAAHTHTVIASPPNPYPLVISWTAPTARPLSPDGFNASPRLVACSSPHPRPQQPHNAPWPSGPHTHKQPHATPSLTLSL